MFPAYRSPVVTVMFQCAHVIGNGSGHSTSDTKKRITRVTRITQILNTEAYDKIKRIERMDNNRHSPYLVQAFSYIENNLLILVLLVAKHLICMTIVNNYLKPIMVCKQNKHIIGKHVSNRYSSVNVAL